MSVPSAPFSQPAHNLSWEEIFKSAEILVHLKCNWRLHQSWMFVQTLCCDHLSPQLRHGCFTFAVVVVVNLPSLPSSLRPCRVDWACCVCSSGLWGAPLWRSSEPLWLGEEVEGEEKPPRCSPPFYCDTAACLQSRLSLPLSHNNATSMGCHSNQHRRQLIALNESPTSEAQTSLWIIEKTTTTKKPNCNLAVGWCSFILLIQTHQGNKPTTRYQPQTTL